MRNPTFEQAFQRQGLKFDFYDKIYLEDINFRAGLSNQARLAEALDEELVNSYADAMKDGADFPPVVLWRSGKGKWKPIDGNQRLAAHQKVGHKWVEAYVPYTTDEMVVDRLTWVWNQLVNGKRLSKEECYHHALTMVRKYSMSASQAAKEWGITQSTLSNMVRAEEAKDAIARQKVNVNLPQEKLNSIGALLEMGEDIVAEVAKQVAYNGATIDDIKKLTKEVRATRTHPQKLKVIEDWSNSEELKVRRAETKGGRVVRPQPLLRDQFSKAIDVLDKLIDRASLEKAALKPVGDQYKISRTQAQNVVDGLIYVFGLGAVMKKEA